MSIAIYKSDICPPCRAVMCLAEILQLDYEAKEISCVIGDNLKPEFIKKNPLHTVPVLEEGDFILVDSHAIMIYLLSKYSRDIHTELYPNDLTLRAITNEVLFFEATKFFPVCRAILRPILLENATGPSEKQISEVNEGYKVLETYLEDTKYVACDYLTIADLSVVTTLSTLETIVPIEEKYEKLRVYLNGLKNKDWYQKINAPGLKKLGDLIKEKIKENKLR